MIDKSDEQPTSRFPIAIIGIGCRLPGGVQDTNSFWRMLTEQKDAVKEITSDRWSISKFYHPEKGIPGKTYAKWAGLLDEIDQFDPEAFGISPREAPHMDPQQRLLLEVAWDAIEDAGQLLEDLSGSRTSVHIGISTNDYAQLQVFDQTDTQPHSATGGAFSIAANRISYCFNLNGPSVAVDTACSSSLVAVDLACSSLWHGETELALAGGVNTIISAGPFIAFCSATMLSPTGRCKTFDASADGFVRGEGAGMVLLKPLHHALRDRDPIHAVILATGVNQDARTSGITLPSLSAQQSLLEEVYSKAGLSAEDVFYVEAHGTGTAVGDPIEATAIGNALGRPRRDGSRLLIGSVKTNIGHLEAGAGIAGLIKTCLVLSHRQIPANLHFSSPNPNIDTDALRLKFVSEPTAVIAGTDRLVAGVNSFGFGGTNAHVVMASVTDVPKVPEELTPPEAGRWLFPISARSEDGLRQLARNYSEYLAIAGNELSMRDLCFTASNRRNHFHHRLAIPAETKDELCDLLRAFSAGEKRRACAHRVAFAGSDAAGPAFVFSGQGPQWWGMGRELLASNETFRQVLEQVDREIQCLGNWSLLEELARDEEHSRMHDTAVAQPALFALQVGLVKVLEEWGIRPAVVVGHSVGEVAAAHVSGALDLATATRVIFHRGRCMAAAPGGKMLALGVSAEEARLLIEPFGQRVSLAAHNGPESVTLSGDADCLEALAERFSDGATFCRFLPVQYAFHSAQMEAIRGELLSALTGIEPCKTTVDMVSTVTATMINGEDLDRNYWWKNVRQAVQFSSALNAVVERGHRVFIELSPHPVLAASMTQIFARFRDRCEHIPTLRRDTPDNLQLLTTLGAIFTVGNPINWTRFWPEGGNCIRLPGYPWQRQRYWHEPEKSRRFRMAEIFHPLLGESSAEQNRYWAVRLDANQFPYFSDHKVRNQIVFPASAYIEMALAASRELFGDPGIVETVQYVKALTLGNDNWHTELRLTYMDTDGAFTVTSQDVGDSHSEWTTHCTGYLRKHDGSGEQRSAGGRETLEEISDSWSKQDVYDKFREVGLNYGAAFQGIDKILIGSQGVEGEVAAPTEITDLDKYLLHPAVLDSCFQVILGAIPEDLEAERVYLPIRVGRVEAWKAATGPLSVRVELQRIDAKELVCNLRLFDSDGELVATIDGFNCQAIVANEAFAPANLVYDVGWEVKALQADHASEPPAFLDSVEAAHEVICGRSRARFAVVEEHLRDAHRALDALAGAHVRESLQELGLDWTPRTKIDPAQAIEDLSIAPRHRQVFLRLLEVLADQGQLRTTDEGAWQVTDSGSKETSQELFREVCHRHPQGYSELMLVQRCGSRLASILSGKTDPLDVLFKQDKNQVAEHFYQDSPSFVHYNALVANSVETAVAAAPLDRIFRILEIGAGTGGLTTHILPVLRPESTEYIFTDISSFFFDSARKKFQDFDFVDYRTLDIEQALEGQQIATGEFDLILASDVLHACRDLREALGHIHSLLAPGGMLLFLEADQALGWVDIIFGLTEGWWRFQDHDIRPDHPLINRERWTELLQDVGFTGAIPMPIENEDSSAGQVVMRARKPLSSVDRQQVSAVLASESSPTGHWLVFADEGRLAKSVSEELMRMEHCVTKVSVGARFAQQGELEFTLPTADPSAMEQLMSALRKMAVPVTGVLYCWPLAAPSLDEEERAVPADAEGLTCYAPMHLLQRWEQAGLDLPSQLLIVTRNAQPNDTVSQPPEISQVPSLGLGRVIGMEFPQLHCRLVDLQEDRQDFEATAILHEIGLEDGESEVLWRGGMRYAARVQRAGRPMLRIDPAASQPPHFRLLPSDTGVIDRVGFRELERQPPGPGQVEIRVRAAGLNFRDVLKALGLYPSDGGDFLLLGDECAGEITAVGPGVLDYASGDRVLAIAPGSFGSYARSRVEAIVAMPAGMTFEDAVTIPIAFLTAYYSLHWLAQIQAGDKVLIQAAAGGVGLAALQIAKLAGAEVFATAGTPEKRELLRNLGADHVMNSRTLEFADEIKALTGGRGVDIVLNSIAGEAIRKGIDCLAPYGRFLELGKRDIYQDSKLGLWGFRSNISFHAIDLSRVIAHRPEVVRQLLKRIVEHVELGEFSALPLRTFPLNRIVEAFRYMAQARHTGKIVISMEGGGPVLVEKRLPTKITIDGNARYLITGGLGGFGLKVAEWLVEKGARHLVLVGRSGAASTEAQQAVAGLEQGGAVVDVQRVDVSDAAQTDTMVAELTREGPPLKGIFHAAMVIDDGVLLQLDQVRFRRVMAPKVDGCWNLHCASLGQPLDYFVLFSSVSAIIGNPGQANYAAANAFLDGFAHYRRARGLPALSVNWGRITGAGYAERNLEVAANLDKRGFLGVSTARATRMLDTLLAQDVTNVGVVPIDWSRQVNLPPKFTRVMTQAGAHGGDEQQGQVRARILQAPPAEQPELVKQYVAQLISRILGIPEDRLDDERPLTELGLDSLMGVELINKLENEVDVRIPNSELMKNPAALQLTEIVMRELGIDAKAYVGEGKIKPIASAKSPGLCLEQLRGAQGPEKPLYCFHASDGDITVYKPLASALDPALPVYGVRSPFLSPDFDGEVADAAALSRLYAAEIRAYQPTGPYRLLGFSYGGLFAVMVAGLLEEQGETVEFVGVVDVDPSWTDSNGNRDEIITDLILSLRDHLAGVTGNRAEAAEDGDESIRSLIGDVMKSTPEERLPLLYEWLSRDRTFSKLLSDELLNALIAAFDRHISLVPGIKLPVVDAKIHCWWSSSEDLTKRSQARDWNRFSKSGLCEEMLDGGHWDIMSAPLIDRIADGIETAVGLNDDQVAMTLSEGAG